MGDYSSFSRWVNTPSLSVRALAAASSSAAKPTCVGLVVGTSLRLRGGCWHSPDAGLERDSARQYSCRSPAQSTLSHGRRDSHTHIVIVVVDSHVPDASPDTALLYVRVACPVRVLGSLLVNEVPATRAPRRSPSFSLGPAQVLTSGSVRRASVRYPHR